MRYGKKGCIAAILLMAFLCGSVNRANAANILVPADQPTLQAAINAAVNNDNIILQSNTTSNVTTPITKILNFTSRRFRRFCCF